MKNLIRKWLGIASIEEAIGRRTVPTKVELRHMVGEAVVAALNGEKDEDWFPWGSKTIAVQALEGACLEWSSKQAKWEVQNVIGNEAFIDKVVERIKRKQL